MRASSPVIGAALRVSKRLTLAVLLTGVTHHGAPIGFADLPQLVASHPLQGVLAGYDRGIAALRSTQRLPGLADPAARAHASGDALERDSAAAQSRVQQIASRGAGAGRTQEHEALTAVLASPNASESEMMAYRDELHRATDANLSAYQASIAQRNQRAFATRQQQFSERELTLAFNLARQNAKQRSQLRLKLDELHLDQTRRTQLEAELAALNAREADALRVVRRNNSADLESYARQLQHDGTVEIAAMTAQLRAKAEANLTLRRQVLQAEAITAAMLPNLPSQLASFAASYHIQADATSIIDGLRNASSELSQRFANYGDAARRSQDETVAQIRALEANRDALYHAMVAQIRRDAERLAQERQLAGVEVSATKPKGSVDLTATVRADLARF